MKFLINFFPALAFFIAFFIPTTREAGIYLATYTLIIASGIQIALYWLLYKKFEKMHLVAFFAVLILGGLTIYFQNEDFIKFKPTVVNWLFGLAFIGSHFLGKKTLFEYLLSLTDTPLPLPLKVFRTVNIVWGLFFIATGIINLYVAFNFSLVFWVNFKTWGVMILNLIFLIGLGCYLYRYIKIAEQTSKE